MDSQNEGSLGHNATGKIIAFYCKTHLGNAKLGHGAQLELIWYMTHSLCDGILPCWPLVLK